MERREHWWNQRYGRLAREDLWLRVDTSQWQIEHRHREQSWFHDFDAEDKARAALVRMMGDEQWRRLS